MITDAILTFLADVVNFFLSLIPRLEWLDTIISAFNTMIAFVCTYIPYALYLFDMPTLKIMVSLIGIFGVFVMNEYVWKLLIKYLTRVV